jgi:hypothetical protein
MSVRDHDVTDYPAIQRQLAASIERRACERGEDILAKVETLPGLGLDQGLRHLAGQVRRQLDLPRDAARDGRFLGHLEHALRDLAVQGAGVR